MRRVKIRDLRNKISEYFENLPFIVTRYGDDIAVVKKLSPDDHFERRPLLVKKASEVCKHGAKLGLCKQGCKK